ncbi:hypothetical protein O6H91_01G008600 [Diphasiastrum complanatum]|uniref:Uncharacterized protein n=1 Tax=Diphasiastrum complanatum TaxID=34168 RepID=A0ACC2EN03_DIPCM|nr:hypothetical protein O6H91_01G008600 [Diphasiastrum complanatum]
MTERRRVHSGLFQSKDNEVICPKPQRLPQFVPSPELIKPSLRLCNTITHTDVEAGFEILDIFFSKSASLCCSPPYFCGSPPSRSDNPLIHDVQFDHGRVSPESPFFLQHYSLCEPAHRFSPLVRVEGFITSGPESRCSVSAHRGF